MNENDRKYIKIVEAKVDDIKDNHLPHIQRRLDWADRKILFVLAVSSLTFAGVCALIGLVIQAIVA